MSRNFIAGLAFSVIMDPGCPTWSQDLITGVHSQFCPLPKPRVSLSLTT